MSNKQRFLLPILSLFLLLSSSFGYSSSIKFITIDVAPWAYYGTDGKLTGVFSDLVVEIEKRTGYSIDLSLTGFSFDRIKRELESGRQDCTAVITDKTIVPVVNTVSMILEHPMGVIARKGITLNSYNDLISLRVSSHKVLSKIEGFIDNPRIHKDFDENYEKGLKKIEHGRIDAVAGAIPSILYIAQKNNISPLLGKPLILKQEPVYLQCSKKSQKLTYMEHMAKVIEEIRVDGTLDKILSKYS